MDYLPLFFDLKQQRCLLVGGGGIALRKARLLVKAGARVRVVAPRVGAELASLVAGDGEVRLETYSAAQLQGCVLVIAATDDETLNAQVSRDARARNLPVNVVDSPRLCSFIMPAIVDRSPLVIGISSGGQAPVLARLLRARIESLVPAAYGRLAGLASRFRDRAKRLFTDVDRRRDFWEQHLQGPVAELVFSGRETEAETLLQKQLEAREQGLPETVRGEVYLVGGGPGDPDLLTFRALRLMQQADVVLYDRLVSEPVLDLVRRDAERIYVGKRRCDHALPQADINQLLVELAQRGQRVLRLKGGDPFIFGRGGEEIERLAEHHIPFQVVPGITAASGCAAYAGIPLTHRDCAQSVRFVTGHLQSDGINLNWPELVEPTQTLVFYMGLTGLTAICEALIAHGRSPATPAALVEKGTTPQQRVFSADIASLPAVVAANEVRAPTLLIIGEVVRLREKLNWFQAAGD
ncbi:uroporphyrinogen-III C-methyltransferase [Exilibacterium tricleocarpae]|uniref:Siroheme synthase n=1 Tax=Exilibacterium tricleocarpae TaxID=2591008 RepID=A0A545T8K0_9GAMM|nr:siroheme synthase CysG [Exilibacterium tricleocarpae]TQV73553.1 uroporphyrinogen-III C-methyltransferase [Exilibacterium tricleocarpae]